MKISFIKQPGGTLTPSSEETVNKMAKLSNGIEYEVDIKVKQNGALHRKMFAFFSFCTNNYYGDSEAYKNKYQLDYVRGELTKIAGYSVQVFNREGGFKIVPMSLEYEKMSPEDRSELYSRLIDAAIARVFNRTNDKNTLNQLYSFF